MTEKEFECWALLGNQVIIFAVEDYERYHARLKWCLHHQDLSGSAAEISHLKVEIEKIHKFMDSKLYDLYTKVPRETIWKKLNEIKEKYKECYEQPRERKRSS